MTTVTKRRVPAKKKVVVKQKNKVVFIMDASGSMGGSEDNVISLLNAQLDALKKEYYASEQETDVSIITFDYSYNIKYVYQDVHIAKARKVTRNDYRTNGATALLDSLAKGINDFLGHEDFNDENVSFVVVAYTDGDENDSKVYRDRGKIQNLIKVAQDSRRFTITLQVPYGKKQTAASYGIPTDNIREWDNTARGVAEASRATAKGLTSYFNSRSLGKTSLESFYVETDLSHLKSSQVKRELDDISSDYGIFVAKNEGQIRDFVEEKTKETYSKGCAYYQLMKKELVQADKEVLIYDKTKLALYGGDEARDLIGLPVGADAKVVPGNHAGYEIFVQSNSVNRKLMVGQKVAVKVT